MGWPDKEQITRAVLDMLTINLDLKEGEKLLVASDVPTVEHWWDKDQAALADMLERAMLAKAVSEIALEHYPGCTVEFYTYPAVGSHGAEPPQVVAAKMRQADPSWPECLSPAARWPWTTSRWPPKGRPLPIG